MRTFFTASRVVVYIEIWETDRKIAIFRQKTGVGLQGYGSSKF